MARVEKSDYLLENLSLSTVFISLILIGQVFNNKYFHVVGPLTLGEILTLSLTILLVLLSSGSRINTPPLSAQISLFLFSIYWVCALISISLSPMPAVSMNFLATVTVQFLVVLAFLLFLNLDGVPSILTSIFVFSLFCALVNFLNSVPGFVDFMQVRQNASRQIAGEVIPLQRVVSFTNIYGQLGALLVFGFFICCGRILALFRVGPYYKTLCYSLALVVISLGIISLQSRATVVGLFVGVLVVIFFIVPRNFRVLLGALCLSLVALFWTPVFGIIENLYVGLTQLQSSTVDTRLSGYFEALKLIGEYPYGVGQGAFILFSEHEAVLHNTFLDAFVSVGWIGGIALLSFVLVPVILLVPSALARNSMAISFLAAYGAVFVILNFYTGLTEYFFWLLVPVGVSLARLLAVGKS